MRRHRIGQRVRALIPAIVRAVDDYVHDIESRVSVIATRPRASFLRAEVLTASLWLMWLCECRKSEWDGVVEQVERLSKEVQGLVNSIHAAHADIGGAFQELRGAYDALAADVTTLVQSEKSDTSQCANTLCSNAAPTSALSAVVEAERSNAVSANIRPLLYQALPRRSCSSSW